MLHKQLSMRTSKSNFQSKEVDVSTKMPSIWVNDILFHPSQILWKKHAEIVIPISPLPKNPPHFWELDFYPSMDCWKVGNHLPDPTPSKKNTKNKRETWWNMNEGELLQKESIAENLEGILGRFLVLAHTSPIKWPEAIGLSFQMAL